MRRSHRLSIPLTLLLAQGCTSILVVGDRDDAGTATADQPPTPDLGQDVVTADAPDVPPAADVPDVTATPDAGDECPFPCRCGLECIVDLSACRLGQVACNRLGDGRVQEYCRETRVAPAGAMCRPAAGVCDIAETCDGVHTGCPADRFLPASTVCGSGVGSCPARTCSGVGPACSAAGGGAEVCNGLDDDCDGLTDEGFCRVGGVCSTNGQLNPANPCQVCVVPSTTVSGPTSWASAPAGSVCRPSAGVCDVTEICDGVRDTCPADVLVASGTVCRPSTGVCDPQETCTGSTVACPANVFSPSSTVCRASAGVCDVAETCTGSSAPCPANAFIPAGTSCRPRANMCDVAETCSGSTAACPVDVRTAEVCDNVDNDCDGIIDEDVSRSCYMGPAGTAGVGACRAGSQACSAGAWGACAGQVLPASEICDALDNDCNGVLNNGITCP